MAFGLLSQHALGSVNDEDVESLVDDVGDGKDDESGVHFDAEEDREQDELSLDSSDDDSGSRI